MNDHWITSPHVITLAQRAMGRIDLDPACSDRAVATWQAGGVDTDGLSYFTIHNPERAFGDPWAGRVWLNPPYSRGKIDRFVDRLIDQLPHVSAAVVLVNAATDTSWFHRLLTTAHTVCFTRGRVSFCGVDGAPVRGNRVGQAIFCYGAVDVAQLSPLGHILPLALPPPTPQITPAIAHPQTTLPPFVYGVAPCQARPPDACYQPSILDPFVFAGTEER